MKHTVESSIQAFVDKTQERNISQPPAPAHPPTPTYPQNISHSHHLGEYSKSIRRSPRRSRSHRHRSMSRRHDKRPVLHEFLGALDVEDPQEESVALHDLDPPLENFPPPGMPHVSQAEPRPSPYAQHLHNVEKDDIVYKIINHHGKPPIHQLLSNPHRGITTHNSLHKTPTLNHSPTTTTNRPPTGGNPGDNGKTIPTPPTHPTHPNGLTTPNHQPATMILMTLPPSHSQHSPPTTPHLIARRRNHQRHRAWINPMLLSMSLNT